ncbi:pyridoxamine 5'-phosphate oxidase family protein [Acinetobacter terrestris]|uniref:Pyridoxamine 5'-phosphate oxidase family protein n=1 Tax=Acinetobacter terrestris TaxID=2529843 RepID=A0ABX1UR99_9GAMM|nr:pyridoxamine 5'-phosphate oxidase family protein [Acinetobacter terrestris]NNH25274.1 pyridoxamine 5'-phosphate oxidase family protein [Acinetobacter terrestris]TCB47066.1 general stress protein [Acinetobacter terrestris]
MTDNQNREKLWELIKDVRYAMISHATETQELHSQPMTMLNSKKTEQMSQSHNLYFILKDSNDLVTAVNSGRNQIGLSFAKPSDSIYVSISAHAHISTDRALIDQLWNPWAENWFKGKEDPSVRVLVAEAVSAEYWNVTDNKVTQLFKVLKGNVTGHAGEVESDHQKLDL